MQILDIKLSGLYNTYINYRKRGICLYSEKFSVKGMSCAACSARVEKAANSVEGVKSAVVNLLTNSMTVTSDKPVDIKAVCSAVSKAGYKAKHASEKNVQDIEDELILMRKRFIRSFILLIPLMYISMGYMTDKIYIPVFLSGNPLAIGLCELLLASSILIVNSHFFKRGFKSLLHGSPNMDTLVALGSGSAFIYSLAVLFAMTAAQKPHIYLHDMYFESAAMIPTLIGFGKMLEAYSKGKATNAVKSLMQLAPDFAHVLRDGKEVTIPSDEVIVGDIFVVKPGESIPVDGIVEDGESTVNESALTGESMPQDKVLGSTVHSATINQNGFITCRAIRVGSDTTLKKIISMVENTAATKAPIARLADRASAVFVPTVMIIAVITAIVWAFISKSVPFVLARAISVLVISCPCALGLATPVAIMAGSTRAAKFGILFKTAASLEITGKSSIVLLDKTGTVTKGDPSITDVIPIGDVRKEYLLQTAASIEKKSSHPLAEAITEYTENKVTLFNADNFSQLAGFGVCGKIGGEDVFGGNAALMEKNGYMTESAKNIGEDLAEQGKTPLYFARNGTLIGIIAAADVPREESRSAIQSFKDMGMPTVLLTGDNRRTANAVMRQIGADYSVADVLPEDKEKVVRSLSQCGKTLMIGDGINDAPALTAADAAIAIGAGTDVAIDAADVVLIKPELPRAVWAVRISEAVIKNIRQNLFWAFFYNCIGIPIAAGVFIPFFGIKLSPMIGAAAMSLSSFCVVTNALRLMSFDPKKCKVKKRKNIPDISKVLSVNE